MSRALALACFCFLGWAAAVDPLDNARAERKAEPISAPTPVVGDREGSAAGPRGDLRQGPSTTQPMQQAGQEPTVGLPIIEASSSNENPVEGIETSAWDFRRRRAFAIRFQHLLANASLASDSIPFRLLPSFPAGVHAVSADDGQGGVYVTWIEGGKGEGDLYALRLTADGRAALGWPAAGAPIALGPYSAVQPVVVAATDGAWIVWQDYRDRLKGSIFAQRIQANGEFAPALPAEGVRVSASENDQSSPSAVSDGEGGLIVAWRTSTEDESALRLLRLNSAGSVAANWPAEGLEVSPKGSRPTDPKLIALSGSTHLLTWEDGGVGRASVRALKIEADGTLSRGWPPHGVTFSGGPGRNSSAQVLPDGQGGAFVAWTSDQDSIGQVFLARVAPNGQAANGWPANGRLVGENTGNDNAASLLSDGAGGVLIAWEDRQTGESDIRGQHFTAGATVAEGWPLLGVVLASSPGHQSLPRLTSDGTGGAFVTWTSSSDSHGEGDASARMLSLVTLRSAEAWPDLVRITWVLDKSLMASGSVQQATIEGRWETAAGSVTRQGETLVFEDARPQAGKLTRYRLILTSNDRGIVLPEVAVSVPAFVPLALHSARSDGQTLHLKLALESRSPARVDGYDVQGRRVLRFDLRNLPPGEQDVNVTLPSHFAPGVYFLRLEQGRASRNGRFVHVR